MKYHSIFCTTALVCTLFLTQATPTFAATVHSVKPGESIFVISQKYGISMDQLRKDNNIKGDTIYPGQKLAIGAGQAATYQVKKGDSLYKISKMFGVSSSSLKVQNGLKSNTIYPGQVLRIPGNTASVSRSSQGSYSEEDLDWLARAVYGEARGESYVGQVAVAAVILNRVEDADFPDTIKGVIFEKNAFTAVNDGQINLKPNGSAIQAAREALSGADPSGGALYYWNPAKSTNKWVWTRPIIKKIGNHVFAI